MIRLLERAKASTGGRVLDLGCGTGYGTAYLRDRGYEAIGLDRLHEGIRATRQAAGGTPLVQGDALRTPFRASTMAAVLLLDVLEHVDDAALLEETRRLLLPDGLLIVTVPAYSWLWSHRDEAAGHLRRYGRDVLRARLQYAGFEVLATGYYQCFLLPLLIVSRRLGRRGPRQRDREDMPPRMVNALFGWVTRLELFLGSWLRWPGGSTVYAVCRGP